MTSIGTNLYGIFSNPLAQLGRLRGAQSSVPQSSGSGLSVSPTHRHQGGGAFMTDILKALSQSGLNTSALTGSSGSQDGDADGSGSGATGNAQSSGSPMQAVAGFMQSLLATLQSIGQQGSSGYGSSQTQMNQLVQQAGTVSPLTSAGVDLSGLNASFQNLSQSLGSSGSASSPTLLSFLQNLQQQMNSQQTGSMGPGMLISQTA